MRITEQMRVNSLAALNTAIDNIVKEIQKEPKTQVSEEIVNELTVSQYVNSLVNILDAKVQSVEFPQNNVDVEEAIISSFTLNMAQDTENFFIKERFKALVELSVLHSKPSRSA